MVAKRALFLFDSSLAKLSGDVNHTLGSLAFGRNSPKGHGHRARFHGLVRGNTHLQDFHGQISLFRITNSTSAQKSASNTAACAGTVVQTGNSTP